MMPKRMLRILLACVLGLFAGQVFAAAQVRATLDRDRVHLGDTVTLSLQLGARNTFSVPDLSVLQKDFQVLGSGISSGFEAANGSSRVNRSINIVLRPLHAGTLNIPALDIGSGVSTEPLTLQVDPASAQECGGQDAPLLVKLSLSTDKPYVGQQVALDLHLYYDVQASQVGSGPLHAGGVRIVPLNRGDRYQTQCNGRNYDVVEMHYALIPQREGTLQLDPVRLYGLVPDAGTAAGFIGNARPVQAQSVARKLEVRAKPAAYGKGAWLPARQVELSLDGVPESGKLRVGQPFTVTLHEGATGLDADRLPKPELPPMDGARVYPDQPQEVTRNNGQWITGSRSRSFAIVPQHAGTLQLPEITLKWWDVVNDRLQTARIPARSVQVLAASGAIGAAPATSTPPPATVTASAASASPAASTAAPRPAAMRPATINGGHAVASSGTDRLWRYAALVLLGLWLATLAVLLTLWRRHRSKPESSPNAADTAATHGDARRWRNLFLAAARGGRVDDAAHALLAWAQRERAEIRNLGELAARLDDDDQIRAIADLQRAQYVRDKVSERHGDAWAAVFRSGLHWRSAPRKAPDQGLPPLYPR